MATYKVEEKDEFDVEEMRRIEEDLTYVFLYDCVYYCQVEKVFVSHPALPHRHKALIEERTKSRLVKQPVTHLALELWWSFDGRDFMDLTSNELTQFSYVHTQDWSVGASSNVSSSNP